MGMTLRDWFAGQAVDAVTTYLFHHMGVRDDAFTREVASLAYQIADAMLAEREKI
jgi:hypothetical protein